MKYPFCLAFLSSLLVLTACVKEAPLGAHGPPCAAGFVECDDGLCHARTCPAEQGGGSFGGGSFGGGSVGGASNTGGVSTTTSNIGAGGSVTPLTAGEVKRITTMDAVVSVQWSPTGETAYLVEGSKLEPLDMTSLSTKKAMLVSTENTTDAWGVSSDGNGMLLGTPNSLYWKDLTNQAETKLIECELCTFQMVPQAGAVSHDDKWVAAATWNERRVFLRDRQGQLKQRSFTPSPETARPFLGIAFSEDDLQVYAHDGEVLYVLSVPDLALVKSIPTYSAGQARHTGTIALIPNRGMLLQITGTGFATVPLDGTQGQAVQLDHPGASLSVSKDGKYASVTTLAYDPTVSSVWHIDLTTLKPTRVFATDEEKGEKFVAAAYISPDGRYIFAAPYSQPYVDSLALSQP